MIGPLSSKIISEVSLRFGEHFGWFGRVISPIELTTFCSNRPSGFGVYSYWSVEETEEFFV